MEARWGKHEYHYTDHKGRPQKKVKRWFGYSVNGIFAERGKDYCRRRGCRFPLSRSAARTKVQPPFSPRCDGSDIRHVKAECGMDCGCACSVPAHEPNNFAKREASSLFADVEGCICTIYSILRMINSTCSVHNCIELSKHFTEFCKSGFL